MVVGVTNEAEGTVRKWVAEKKPEYPIAIVAGNRTFDEYQIKAFPTVYLVGPEGTIAEKGGSESAIEEALARAFFVPNAPAKWKAINADLAKKDYGKAHAAIAKELAKGADPDLARVKDAIEGLATRLSTEAGAAGAAGDYAGGVEMLDDLAKRFKGLPQADEAAKKAKEWRSDKAIKEQIKAGEDLKKAAALEKLGDPAARRKAYQIYADVAKKMKDTPVGQKAQAAADRLKGG